MQDTLVKCDTLIVAGGMSSPSGIDVMAYGAIPGALASDNTVAAINTAAIQKAINASVGNVTNGTNTTGGRVLFPAGNFVHNGLTFYTATHFEGAGIEATILTLANGANTDCFQGFNTNVLIGGSSSGGVHNFSFRNLTIDGNKSNQSGVSSGIRFYGYGYILENIRVRNTLSDALRSDWNGGGSVSGSDQMEGQASCCKFHDTGANATGINITGPHDSQFENVECFLTGGPAFYQGPNAGGCQWSNCHGWGVTTGVNNATWLLESIAICSNCEAEGSDVMQVVFLSNTCVWKGGRVFSGGVSSNNVGGVQLGQAAGQTPYNGSSFQSAGVTTAVAVSNCMIDTLISRCEGTNGAVFFGNDGGHNFIQALCVLSASGNTNVTTTGSITGNDQIYLLASGVTSDGSIGKAGKMQVSIDALKALTIRNASTGNDLFNYNTNASRSEWVNGAILRLYSDNYTTRTVEISGGTISVLQSTTAAATATSGTITTSGVGVARVAPTGNITAVVLQAGTLAGQRVVVVNESAFTVTFDVQATSHVADGATAAIPANAAREFVWDSSTSLWYRLA